MRHIYNPVTIKVDFPKEILDYLSTMGYLNEMRSFSGDLCIHNYTASKELGEMVISNMLSTGKGSK